MVFTPILLSASTARQSSPKSLKELILWVMVTVAWLLMAVCIFICGSPPEKVNLWKTISSPSIGLKFVSKFSIIIIYFAYYLHKCNTQFQFIKIILRFFYTNLISKKKPCFKSSLYLVAL